MDRFYARGYISNNKGIGIVYRVLGFLRNHFDARSNESSIRRLCKRMIAAGGDGACRSCKSLRDSLLLTAREPLLIDSGDGSICGANSVLPIDALGLNVHCDYATCVGLGLMINFPVIPRATRGHSAQKYKR